VFRVSSTIGFRETAIRRLSLRRDESRITGGFGEARVKTAFLGEEPIRAKVEYEDRARVARERGCSLETAERFMAGGKTK
jgi:uncharacterized protein (DUF111 family)